MALVPCPECANQVSDQATACPKCGHPLLPGRSLGAPPAATAPVRDSAAPPEQPTVGTRPSTRNTGVDKRVLIAIGVVVAGVAGLMAIASSRLKAQQAQTAEEQRKHVALATRLGAEALETKRKQSVASGVAGGRVIASAAGACGSPDAVSDARSSLKLAKAEDAEWAEASALLIKLEPCQQRIAKQAAVAAEAAQKKAVLDAEVTRRKAAATAAATAMAGRLAWASAAEKKMLDAGMEVDFIVTGSNKDLLTVKWVLMSKVQVYRLTNDDSMAEGSFLSNLQKAGFRKVTFSDGYNYGVTYTLPQSN